MSRIIAVYKSLVIASCVSPSATYPVKKNLIDSDGTKNLIDSTGSSNLKES